jgi:hypothetical protein
VTIEKQEDRPDYEEDDPERMASMAHYVMMHYAEKESIKRNEKRNINPRLVNTVWRPD